MFKLPKFVNIYICSYLTLKDLIFLQRTSKGWHNFSKLDDLWLFKLKIDYPHVNYNVYEDHFKLYKYMTLSVGYVFEVCGSRLDKPHHLLRGKILKQYLDFLPLSYRSLTKIIICVFMALILRTHVYLCHMFGNFTLEMKVKTHFEKYC